MESLANDDNPDNFSDFIETSATSPLDNLGEHWSSYDFDEPLFTNDEFLGNYNGTPINSFPNPYDDICMGLDSEFENISGSSSDSGLDIDAGETLNYLNHNHEIQDKNNEIVEKNTILQTDHINSDEINFPKVVVQKVPQVFTVSNKSTLNSQKEIKQIENITKAKEIKIVKVAPFNSVNKNVTIQIKNSNTNGKIQTNPGTFFISKGKLAEVKKTIQHTKSPHSILIPVSVSQIKDLKGVKLVKAVPKTHATNIVLQQSHQHPKTQITSGEYADDIERIDYDSELYSNDKDGKYPKLILTSEEKRLLAKEGISLPQHYPLTKNEERELKRIRRKIRNKISAQDSRKRKKDYVIGLEARVKQCTEENQNLMKRIKMLQLQNQSLVSQMKKMQTLLTKGTDKITHPTTCLMVLLMSLALITAPNLNLSKQKDKEVILDEFSSNTQDVSSPIHNRNLLSNTKSNVFESFNDVKGLPVNNQNNLKLIDYDIDENNWYEMKPDAENNSNHNHFSNNMITSLPSDDVNKNRNNKGSIIESGDILDLFSTSNLFNFDIPDGGGKIDENQKFDIRNVDNDALSVADFTNNLNDLNVLSFPS